MTVGSCSWILLDVFQMMLGGGQGGIEQILVFFWIVRDLQAVLEMWLSEYEFYNYQCL